jgi:DNA primase
VEQKKYVSQELLPLLQILQDPIERGHYTNLIAQNYDISTANLKVAPVAKTESAQQQEAEQLGDSASSSLENTEKEILGGLLYFPELRSTLLPKLNLKVFSLPVVVEGIELLQKGQIEAINQGLSKEVLFMVEFNLEQNSGNTSAYIRELERTYKTLQLSSLKISLQRLTNLIKQAEARADRVELEKLNREYAIKLAERSTLELAD